jgi:hypothetical protein
VSELRDEVKRTLALLAAAAPGRSVEVRVPPFAAIQCIEGPVHRRGKPGSVIECDAQTWLDLAHGRLTWPEAVAAGRVHATGERADLSEFLPLGGPEATTAPTALR